MDLHSTDFRISSYAVSIRWYGKNINVVKYKMAS